MNRYEPQAPRLAFGVAASAAASIPFGTLVALPARLDAIGPSFAQGSVTVVATREPHVDSDSVSRTVDARVRHHDLLARAVGAMEHASELRLAGAPRWHFT